MTSSILALPVTVEQLAATIRQMRAADLQRLLALVPTLRHLTVQAQPQMPDAAWTAVERVRNDVILALADQRLSPDDPFLGDLTLGQYLDLPDEEWARLWQGWTETDLDAIEERDVRADALPARYSDSTTYPGRALEACRDPCADRQRGYGPRVV